LQKSRILFNERHTNKLILFCSLKKTGKIPPNKKIQLTFKTKFEFQFQNAVNSMSCSSG